MRGRADVGDRPAVAARTAALASAERSPMLGGGGGGDDTGGGAGSRDAGEVKA